MTDIELIGYLAVLMISVLWSVLAIERGSALFSFLGFLSWMIESQVHIAYSWDTNLYMLTYLYWGFAWFFFVCGFALFIQNVMRARTQKREDEMDDGFPAI